MGSSKEEEAEPIISTPKLPLLSIQAINQSPEHSGMLTPPIHTSASVPFRWEEEPGKPLPCTALITSTSLSHDPNNISIKGLELPPRLQLITDPKTTKMPSPTTVLDGPYLPLLQSSSFRFARRERQGSFGSSCGSPERGQYGNNSIVVSKNLEGKGRSGRFFGSWRRKSQIQKLGKSEVGGCSSSVFSNSGDLAGFGFDDHESGGGGGGVGGAKVKKMWRIRRKGSISSISQVGSHLWATIYGGFKQVLPRKSTDSKKDGLPI